MAVSILGVTVHAAEPPLPSFENLLRELQATERGATSSDRPADREAIATSVDQLVNVRNVVFNRDGGLFNSVLETGRVEREYAVAVSAANAAGLRLANARSRLAQETAESLRRQQETPALKRAEAEFNQAEAELRTKNVELQSVAARLTNLYARLRRNLPDFFRNYMALRQVLPYERSPINAEIANCLERRAHDCSQWVEGHVLMAVASAYAGDESAAQKFLEQAGQIMKECPPLITTILAEDCCSTWLLLGKTDKVAQYVAAIRNTPARYRTAMQEWMLGADARVQGRYDDASKFLSAAMGKAKKRAPAALIAEAAFVLLLGDSKGKRTAKAADLLADVKEDDSWSVLQSRAALAAAQERWGDAVHLIEACRAKAPLCIDEDLEQQHASYADEKVWRP